MYMIRDPQDPSFSPVSGHRLYRLCGSTHLAGVIIGPRYSRQIHVFATSETDDQRADVYYRLGRTCRGIAPGGAIFAKLGEALASQVVLQVSLECMVDIYDLGVLIAAPITPLPERPSLRSLVISSQCYSSCRIIGDDEYTLVQHCVGF